MICPGMKKRKPKEKEGLAKMEEDGGENDEEYEKMLKDVEDEVYAFVSDSFLADVRSSNHTPRGLIRIRIYHGDSACTLVLYHIEHFHFLPGLCCSQ